MELFQGYWERYKKNNKTRPFPLPVPLNNPDFYSREGGDVGSAYRQNPIVVTIYSGNK